MFNDFATCGCEKRGLRRKYLYFCLIYILRHLLSNQAFCCSGMIWTDIVAVSRPFFRGSESSQWSFKLMMPCIGHNVLRLRHY
jgi:hypothetical protein